MRGIAKGTALIAGSGTLLGFAMAGNPLLLVPSTSMFWGGVLLLLLGWDDA